MCAFVYFIHIYVYILSDYIIFVVYKCMVTWCTSFPATSITFSRQDFIGHISKVIIFKLLMTFCQRWFLMVVFWGSFTVIFYLTPKSWMNVNINKPKLKNSGYVVLSILIEKHVLIQYVHAQNNSFWPYCLFNTLLGTY